MTLARQLVRCCQQPVPAVTLDRARRHIVDWIACVVGAANEPLARTLARALHSAQGPYPSFGIGHRNHEAALIYAAALGNLLELDDLIRDALVHPGPVIVPTAVYYGLQQECEFHDVLSAIAKGYQAAGMLGRSLDAHHYRRWHPTTTVGIPAAAITASAIAKLDANRMLNALGNSLSVSGGLWHARHHPVDTKQWHIVHAVMTGIRSATLSNLGFTASDEIIEGEQGWHDVMTAAPNRAAFAGNGDWVIHATSFKPWPACRHCHPVIDAALELRQSIDPTAVTAVTVETYQDAMVFCDNIAPQTSREARFSLQHCVAVAMLKGTVDVDDFNDAARACSSTAALRERVQLRIDAAIDQAYPRHFGACVRVTLGDGNENAVIVHDAKGDPEIPLSDDDLAAKFKRLWTHGLGSERDPNVLLDSLITSSLNLPFSNVLEAAP